MLILSIGALSSVLVVIFKIELPQFLVYSTKKKEFFNEIRMQKEPKIVCILNLWAPGYEKFYSVGNSFCSFCII